MDHDLSALCRRSLDNLRTLAPVTDDMTRVLPEEADAIRRLVVILHEWSWEARRI